MMYLYSRRGVFHKETGCPNGDAVRSFDTADYSIVVLADGVSTCKYGDKGADIVAGTALQYLKKQYERLGFLPCGWHNYMLKQVLNALMSAAEKMKSDYKEYSATLITIVFDKKKKQIEYFNLGDGLILSVEKGRYTVLSKPESFRGLCPAVTTEGIADTIRPQCRCLAGEENILLCTDGLWKRMYQHKSMDPLAREALALGDIKEFVRWIERENAYDDCSFAMISMKEAA